MNNELTQQAQYGEMNMQQINSIVNQLKAIMQDNDISQYHLVQMLEGKVTRNTILGFFKDADCKLSTLLMILDACGVELRLDTERSKEALMAGDIAAYRQETEEIRGKLDKSEGECKFFKERYEELIDKNTSLTETISKQQTQIEKYMERMENAENALYASNADCRRKDAKILEMLNKYGYEATEGKEE